jgi:hypothetical protein
MTYNFVYLNYYFEYDKYSNIIKKINSDNNLKTEGVYLLATCKGDLWGV